MFAQLAFLALISSGQSSTPFAPTPVRNVVVLHPALNSPDADVSADSADLLPRIVRTRIEEIAGDAPIHHAAIAQQHGVTIYTARYIDEGSGVEQLITVAQDGRVLFIEPVLLSAFTGEKHFDAVRNINDVQVVTVPAGKSLRVSGANWLEVPMPGDDDQRLYVKPAHREGR